MEGPQNVHGKKRKQAMHYRFGAARLWKILWKKIGR